MNKINFLDWYSEKKKINQKRLQLSHETCSKYKNEFEHEIENPKHFVFVDKIKTMGCYIEKVGSTSLRQGFRDLRLNLGMYYLTTIPDEPIFCGTQNLVTLL